jgi:phage baseplate assembly protein W
MRSGVDAQTGKPLTGWAHCVQSVRVILTTHVGALKWRRLFGADIWSIQDQNASAITLISLYRAVAEAIDQFEPGFKLETIEMVKGGRDGAFSFMLSGIFYPRGHLGIFDDAEMKTADIIAFPEPVSGPGRIEVIAA